MQRGNNVRQPSPGQGMMGAGMMGAGPPSPSSGGFRSPAGAGFGSPIWGYRGGRSPSAGPRFGNFGGGVGGGGGGGGSPTSSRDFGNNNNNRSFGPPSEGGYRHHHHTPSPKRWQDGAGGGGGEGGGGGPSSSHFRHQSPYRRGYQQGSPQTSTPFGRGRGRRGGGGGGGGGGGVEKYYSPAMVQDPWASLKPVGDTTHTGATGATPNAFNTGKHTRYF